MPRYCCLTQATYGFCVHEDQKYELWAAPFNTHPLYVLLKGPKTVAELMEHTGLREPAVTEAMFAADLGGVVEFEEHSDENHMRHIDGKITLNVRRLLDLVEEFWPRQPNEIFPTWLCHDCGEDIHLTAR